MIGWACSGSPSTRAPVPQGGGKARATRLALPWAMMFNAFGVCKASGSAGSHTWHIDGRFAPNYSTDFGANPTLQNQASDRSGFIFGAATLTLLERAAMTQAGS